jgi:2-C-methyl-D-erythritol 4-phosphate cytidylyltransferase
MGGTVEKQFICLRGIPILAHTLKVFDQSPLVDGVVLVVASRQRQSLEEMILGPYPCRKLIEVVRGGRERQESVSRGLDAVPAKCEYVVIHDGVRPLVTSELLAAVLKAAQSYDAALAAIPARDTVKHAEDGQVKATLERETIWLAQTPQAFQASLLRRAYGEVEQASIIATDDAALVERLGVEVQVVQGSPENIKVTTPSDLVIAEALLAHRSAE